VFWLAIWSLSFFLPAMVYHHNKFHFYIEIKGLKGLLGSCSQRFPSRDSNCLLCPSMYAQSLHYTPKVSNLGCLQFCRKIEILADCVIIIMMYFKDRDSWKLCLWKFKKNKNDLIICGLLNVHIQSKAYSFQ
jgi:hypothetical protein